MQLTDFANWRIVSTRVGATLRLVGAAWTWHNRCRGQCWHARRRQRVPEPAGWWEWDQGPGRAARNGGKGAVEQRGAQVRAAATCLIQPGSDASPPCRGAAGCGSELQRTARIATNHPATAAMIRIAKNQAGGASMW